MSSTPQLLFEPDRNYSSSNPAPIASEFAQLHAKLGKLVVNRWTYRPLRFLGRLTQKPIEIESVKITQDPSFGDGALLIEPAEIKSRAALLLMHGGGFVIGEPMDVAPKAAFFAKELGIKVVCASYRLAPKAKAPAALEDCHLAWSAMLTNAQALGIDPAKIVIGGYSAGAGLAACLAQKLRDEGGVQPCGQLLIYPMLDDATAANRSLDSLRHSVWSNRNNLFGWTSLLGQPPGGQVKPYSVAARCDDLKGLPPAWIGVGSADLFLDEDRAFADALKNAGVKTEFVEAPGAIHGFDMAPMPMSQAFVSQQLKFLKGFV
ncbi:MAG: alpha/beta hydrolase [Pseudomonadota bacterium]